jgi:Type II intron maturase
MTNYYILMIDNYHPYTQIQCILEYSCYDTIAKKYKSSIFKIFNTYGKPPQFKIETDIKFFKNNPNIKNSAELPIKTKKIMSYLQNKMLLIFQKNISYANTSFLLILAVLAPTARK